MKNLINRTLTLSLPVIGALLFMASPAQANEEAGVHCPAGYTAAISDGNRLLKCTATRTYTLPSVCPLTYAMNSAGSDQCNPLRSGTTVASTPDLRPPNYPNVPYVRQINSVGPDTFSASVVEFAFPVGGLPYVFGDKSKGVRCPSGFDGDQRFNGTGIRCDKDTGTPKNGDCDVGWGLSIDHNNGNTDKCLGITTGDTKPSGITYIQLQAEQALGNTKWVRNVQNGRDTWQKRNFAFPSHID